MNIDHMASEHSCNAFAFPHTMPHYTTPHHTNNTSLYKYIWWNCLCSFNCYFHTISQLNLRGFFIFARLNSNATNHFDKWIIFHALIIWIRRNKYYVVHNKECASVRWCILEKTSFLKWNQNSIYLSEKSRKKENYFGE